MDNFPLKGPGTVAESSFNTKNNQNDYTAFEYNSRDFNHQDSQVPFFQLFLKCILISRTFEYALISMMAKTSMNATAAKKGTLTK